MSKRRFRIEQGKSPDYPGMMLVSIEVLKKLGGSATVHELDEAIIELEGVSEEEQSLPMSPTDDRNRLRWNLAWARTFLRQGGAIENSSRGVWALTESGAKIETVDETRAIRNLVIKTNSEKKKSKRQDEPTDGTDIVDLEHDEPEAAEHWKTTLLGELSAISPESFERLSQRLLREAGFSRVEVRGKTGDGGIDGVGVLSVNLVSFQIYFQCKRWKGSVGSKEIRDFRGALQGRADKGLFITTGRFTSDATNEAAREGAIAIDLIDGDRLCDLLKHYSLGVKTQMVESVSVESDYFRRI